MSGDGAQSIDDPGQACCTSAYVVIVGTEVHYNSYGNKMMFWAPAVRKMFAQGLVGTPNHFFVLHFTDGYSSAETDAVNQARIDANAIWRDNIHFVACSSASDVFDFFDTGVVSLSGCSGVQITRVDFYAHGLPTRLAFGYEGPNAASQEIDNSNITRLSVDHLASTCKFWSYACRTGNGDTRVRASLPGFSYSNAEDALPADSLAQKLADHTRCEVKAWLTRTYYGAIWNDDGDAGYRAGFRDLDDPNSVGRHGWESPIAGTVTWWSPFHSENNGKVLWNIRGAKHEVSGASTPGGLSNLVRTYSPSDEGN